MDQLVQYHSDEECEMPSVEVSSETIVSLSKDQKHRRKNKETQRLVEEAHQVRHREDAEALAREKEVFNLITLKHFALTV